MPSMIAASGRKVEICIALTSGDEEVADLEAVRVVGRQRWPPGRIVGEIRLGVGANDADDDLGDDSAADLAEAVASALDCRLAEDIQPEGRLILPVSKGVLLTRQCLFPNGAGDCFAGRQACITSAP